MKLSHLPLRATVGAFVLNSGLSKRGLEGQAAAQLHAMAAGAMPRFKQMPPERFAKLLANTEVALGAALLSPRVPSALVGTGLAGFGAGLVRLYWKTPGMHKPRSPRPTQEGIGLAKDVWLLGAGLTLLLDDLLLRRRGPRRGRPRKTMRRAAMPSMAGLPLMPALSSMRRASARLPMRQPRPATTVRWGMPSVLRRAMRMSLPVRAGRLMNTPTRGGRVRGLPVRLDRRRGLTTGMARTMRNALPTRDGHRTGLRALGSIGMPGNGRRSYLPFR